MDPGVIAALIAAIVSLVIAVLNSLLTGSKLRDERRQWRTELGAGQTQWQTEQETKQRQWQTEQETKQRQWQTEQETKQRQWQEQLNTKLAELEAQFLYGRVAQRYKYYPAVFEVLGRVRDVPDPKQEHYNELVDNKEILQNAAAELLTHLYGDAGLVMRMSTRNAVLRAWLACKLFQAGDKNVQLRQLIGYFFFARRWLRADLQIEDDQGVESELDEIRERFGLAFSDKVIDEYMDIGPVISLGPLRT
jgi:hypothetical protein